jgi:hypothetical protein
MPETLPAPTKGSSTGQTPRSGSRGNRLGGSAEDECGPGLEAGDATTNVAVRTNDLGEWEGCERGNCVRDFVCVAWTTTGPASKSSSHRRCARWEQRRFYISNGILLNWRPGSAFLREALRGAVLLFRELFMGRWKPALSTAPGTLFTQFPPLSTTLHFILLLLPSFPWER